MDNNKPELAAIHLQEKYEVPGTSDDVSMLCFELLSYSVYAVLVTLCTVYTQYNIY